MKRLFSLFLAFALVFGIVPVSHAQETAEPIELTDADYAIVNEVFAQIDAMEDAPAKKNTTQTQKTDAAIQIVMASENYVEGSLERNGNSFTWWTDEGIRCIYNPYMREKYDNMQAPENPEPAGIYNAPKATKGGWPTSKQVYLIGPYYGMDDSFTEQYKNEAKSIAAAIGDTDGYTLYSGKSATIDLIADAMERGAVVIFDSHGTTDYEGSYIGLDPDGYEVYDYVSGAKYSYLCLTSKAGLTTEDYNDGATYFTDSEGLMCACVNGAAIANHMEKNSPAGLLWMAICLGMATDTMCQPMRAKGVEVVYGYSQSVTFAGDYCFEETFWDNMIAGKTVAESIRAMKSKWGSWDWSEPIASEYGWSGTGYTLSEARKYRSAFPVVVSDEDAHPGQRDKGTNYGACSEQTVKSTYTLFSQAKITANSNNTAWGGVAVSGDTITATPATGYFAQSATVTAGTAAVTQNGNVFTVNAATDCTVQINFAPKAPVTVNFIGANAASQTGYSGDAMILPVAENAEGYQFVGWIESKLAEDTKEKPNYYTDSFVPTVDTTLYALYSYEMESDGPGDYVKVTTNQTDWSGEYLIVYEDDGWILDSSLPSIDTQYNYRTVTITDGTISSAEGDPCKFTISAVSGGYSLLGANNKYISGSSGSNKLNAGTSAAANTLSIDADGNADIVSNTSHMRYNSGDHRFRYYKSSSYTGQEPVTLYKKSAKNVAIYYTTDYTAFLCNHENTHSETIDATCKEEGIKIVYCDDCGEIILEEFLPVADHSYENGVCSVCGQTQDYVDSWNLILGDRIGVNFYLALTEENAANTQVRFTLNGHSTTADAADAQIRDGKYVFGLDVSAAQMTEEITVEVLHGGKVVESGSYTVRQYAQYILSNTSGAYSAQTVGLVKAMLSYGAQAQRYFGSNVGSLADAGYEQTEFTSVPETVEKAKITGSVTGAAYYGATLLFRSNVAVRFYFTGDVSGLKFTVNGQEQKAIAKGDMSYVEIDGIVPQNLDQQITLTVTDPQGGTMIITYGPMNYMVNMSAAGSAGLQELLLKMYNYHLAAKNYTK